MDKQKMKFGLPTLVELATLEEHFQLAKSMGLDFVEINNTFPPYQVEKLRAECIDKLMEKYQLYVTFHLDENINIGDFNRNIAHVYIESVLATIELAKKLGSPYLTMHMAESIKISLPDRKLYLFEEYLDDYLHRLFAFRVACEKAICQSRVKVCVENLNGFQSFHQKGVDLLLESQAFGLTLDIGHEYVTNHADETFIQNRKNRLTHFHIHDANEHGCHLELGTGNIPLHTKLELARSHGGSCVIEVKTVQALTNSVNWLKENGWLLTD